MLLGLRFAHVAAYISTALPSLLLPLTSCTTPNSRRTWLGVEPVGAASSRPQPLLQYLVGPDVPQQQLVAFLQHLEGLAGAALGVLDIQASLASLEEVFLNIAKQVGVLLWRWCMWCV